MFSENAEKVELCIFDDNGRFERQRIIMRERTDYIWHMCYSPGSTASQWRLYSGYRVHGPGQPGERSRGLNPHRAGWLDP